MEELPGQLLSQFFADRLIKLSQIMINAKWLPALPMPLSPQVTFKPVLRMYSGHSIERGFHL